MSTRKRKVELVKCSHTKCKNQFDKDKPPFAMIRFPMPLYCSEECLNEGEKK